MPNLLLVDPIHNPGNIPFSLSLGAIEAAFIEKGVNTRVCDFFSTPLIRHNMDAFRQAENDFIAGVAACATESAVVFICAEHGNELKPYPILPRVLTLATAVKMRNPRAAVIVGGGLVTLLISVYGMSEIAMGTVNVDAFVSGQTIKAIPVIGRYLGFSMLSHDVPSHWHCWSGEKYPDYASIQIRSGCAYKCDFCFEGKIFSKDNLTNSLDSVKTTIQNLKRDWGVRKIVIEDSVILSYPDFHDLVEMVADEHIAFSAYVRVSEICKWPDRVGLLRQAGCTCVIIGIETLDDGILAATNKKIVASHTKKALEILRTSDLDAQGCLMLGFPDGGISDAVRTIDFALEQELNCYRWHVYMPNYSALPDALMTPSVIGARDLYHIQIDVPDRLLFQQLSNKPHIGFLDEHALVRSLPFLPDDISILEGFGYAGFRYADLVRVMKEKLLPVGLPLNEDDMYDLLFNCSA